MSIVNEIKMDWEQRKKDLKKALSELIDNSIEVRIDKITEFGVEYIIEDKGISKEQVYKVIHDTLIKGEIKND